MTAPTSVMGGALQTEQDKLLSCVHCGLCLEACPTYIHTGDENDSPRGRIYLMRAVEENSLPLESPIFARHINRCLGCRACEQACPAGVEYGQLLEAARHDLHAAERPHTPTDSLLNFVLRHVWLQPRRLRLAFAAARVLRDSGLPHLLLKSRLPQLISPRLAFSLAMLESSAPGDIDDARHVNSVDDANAALAGAAIKVRLFTGCVTEGLFARVNRATARVLRVNGYETAAPKSQVCCGALHAHAGDLEGARALARRNIEAFGDDHHHIVTNAGGCGAMLSLSSPFGGRS
ncbi:MAG: heterodisulfide reductase-related iron-sulfur binding cluster [Pyrinomonadaceae bacterium]